MTSNKSTLLGMAAVMGLGLLAMCAKPAAADPPAHAPAWGRQKKQSGYINDSRYRNGNSRDGHRDAGGSHDTSNDRYRNGNSRDGHWDAGGWHDTSNDRYRGRDDRYDSRYRRNPNDIDRDGIPNNRDRDVDGDRIPNSRDRDIDGDRIPNSRDRDDYSYGNGQTYDSRYRHGRGDTDRDGVRNRRDRDVDGDGRRNWRDRDMDGDGRRNRNDRFDRNPSRR